MFLIVVLLLVIGGLSWYMFFPPSLVTDPTPLPEGGPTPSLLSAPVATKPIVTSPPTGASVGKSFAVTGMAPGSWYFEASFPIQVRDKDNNKIGQAVAQAQGDWMTTGMVPFTASISTSGYTGPAMLVLLKDNPSGLPENDDSIEISIMIK